MKRLFTLLFSVILLYSTTLFAQEVDMHKVAERYKGIETFRATVIRTSHHVAIADDVVTKGYFYFKKPNKTCMIFNEGKDVLLMDNAVFTMINDGKKSIARGATHKQFEALLAVCKNIIAGKNDNIDINELADVQITKQGDIHTLVITPVVTDAKAKRRMMFTSFVLTIDAESSNFKSLRMNRKGNNYTQYDFSDYTPNTEVNDNIFNT